MKQTLFFMLILFTVQCSPKLNQFKKDTLGANTHQKELNNFYLDQSTSILDETSRKALLAAGGHPFFEYNANYKIRADFETYTDPEQIQMKTSTTRLADYLVYGKASFELEGSSYSLYIYQNMRLKNEKDYDGHLFLPFTDLTSGESSYGGGRYIDLKIPEDKGHILIDFNHSYHPYCAYTKGYSCPIPPVENFIDMKIEAGIQYVALSEDH